MVNYDKFNSIPVEQQEVLPYLDALLVLGGESDSFPSRSNHAIDLYLLFDAVSRPNDSLCIVLSGNHSGSDSIIPDTSHAQIMKDNLISKNISDSNIYLESDSLDTLAGLYFSKKIILENKVKNSSCNVGLVTDPYHMNRTLWLANKVFGSDISYFAMPSKLKRSPLFSPIKESLIISALRYDLRKISPGDDLALEEYLSKVHPFHAENPSSSLYGLGVKLNRLFK